MCLFWFPFLIRNGIGTDAIWKCIGDVVDTCEQRSLTPPEQIKLGQSIANYMDSSNDVQSIRDAMRDKLANANAPVDVSPRGSYDPV